MNTKLKPYVAPVLLVAVLSWMSLGCSTIQTGSDPVVVRAEQTQVIAFDTVDLILKQEYTYRSLLPAESKVIADALRTHFKPANDALKNAIRSYKANRTEEGKANLTTALAVVESMLTDAQKWQANYGAKKSGTDPFSLAMLALGMIQGLITWYQKLRVSMAQTKELTPEQEAELDAKQAEMMKAPHWKIEY